MLLQGIFPPITTPFYPDGNVYFKKLEANVERYSKTPIAGIVALGSTGEAVMLSDQERRDVLKGTREAAARNKVLIAGTGSESAIDTLKLTEYAAELGYDVALVRTPFYYKKQMHPANILAFYRTVADRSPLPVMIYSVPPFTGYDIPVELVIELADHPNIIGMKESGGDVEKVRRMVEGTRYVKRSATVTETFDAVTPRMLKASAHDNGQSRELVPAGALAGSAEKSEESHFVEPARPFVPSSHCNFRVKDAAKRSRIPRCSWALHRRSNHPFRSARSARFSPSPTPPQPRAMRFTPHGKRAILNLRD